MFVKGLFHTSKSCQIRTINDPIVPLNGVTPVRESAAPAISPSARWASGSLARDVACTTRLMERPDRGNCKTEMPDILEMT
ncbi:hypothetical protein NPIL_17491 [Nephila pilipes]|uniref:Uncharacterized protein n=1 Tax=Nephila pilipes TaxID=299642 RepID=A0A8X6PTC1_NEPPI|nr:hypothetical protein NPIL_17491 [Nephila pilipes]